MSFQDLTSFNETLRNQIWDLRELVANLSMRNYELKEEIKDVQILNHGLQAKMGCYKTLMEELQKERKNIKDTVQQREERLPLLEYKNKTLKSANKQLILQISGMADQLAACEDYRTVINMLGNRSEAQKIEICAQCLEDKLARVQQQYEKEKQQTSQLQEAFRELAQICESQGKDIMQLKGELEAAEKQAALQRRDHECWLPSGLIAVGWRQDQDDKNSSEPAVMRKLHWLKDLRKILAPFIACVALACCAPFCQGLFHC